MERRSNSRRSSPTPGTKALSRAVDILRVFTHERPRWTLAKLCAELDLRKSTGHRILTALEREGLLTREPDGVEYRLGPELIVLGGRALKTVDVRELARPELRATAEATGYDATLEILAGWDVILLHEERGRSILGTETPVGTLWPAHATSTGKALLAFSEEPLERPPGELDAITEHTIVSWQGLKAALSEVRRSGYATNLQELEYGYCAVGAPVRGLDGRPVAAVSLGGPVHRVNEDRIPEIVEIVKETASNVSRRLGHRREIERARGIPVPVSS